MIGPRSKRCSLRGVAVLSLALAMLLPVAAEAIMLESPNGGDQLRSGGTWTVRWSDPGAAVGFSVYYSLDGGKNWSRGTGVQSYSSLNWKVPIVSSNKRNCLVEVRAYDGTGHLVARDRSDAPFTISLLRLLTPAGQETFTPGEVRPIRWELNRTRLTDGYLAIDFTTDSGKTWKTLKQFRGLKKRRHLWTVPDVVSEECAVRVRLLDTGKKPILKSRGSNFAIGTLVVNPSAKVADPPTIAVLTSATLRLDGSTILQFSSETPFLAALTLGTPLVLGQSLVLPQGAFGIVRSKIANGGAISVELAPAVLTDLIQQGTLSINDAPDPATFTFQPAPGVTARRVSVQNAADTAGVLVRKYVLELSGTLTSPGGGTEIELSGSVSLGLELDVMAKFGFFDGLSWIRVAVTPEEEFNAELAIRTRLPEAVDAKLKLGTVIIPNLWIFPGGIPVCISLAIDVYVGAKGEIWAYASTGVEQSARWSFGLEWDKATDLTRFINEGSLSFAWTPLELGVEGSVEAYGRLEPGLLFYGVAGPVLSLTNFLRLEGQASTADCVSMSLSSGLRAGVGGKFQLFGKEWDWENEFEERRERLWQGTFCDPPVVTIVASDATATEEGPATGQFTVSRTGTTESSLVAYYTVGGSAAPGTDYVTLPGNVTIPAGSASTAIMVAPVSDALIEGNETVAATLSARPSYAIGNPSTATVTILDQAPPPPPPTSPPTAATGGGTPSGTTTAILSGTANPKGSTTVGWHEWGTTTSYGNTTPQQSLGSSTSAVSFSNTVTGASPGGTYHFRAAAQNPHGTAYGSDMTFTMPQSQTLPPAVTTYAPASISDNGAILYASVNFKGSPGAAWFQYGTTASYGWTSSEYPYSGTAQTPLDVTIPVSGLASGTPYHVMACARNGGGTTCGSDVVFTTTTPAVVEPPTNVQATDNWCDRIRITFTCSPNATGYLLYRGTSADPAAATLIAQGGLCPQYDDQSAATDTTYWYFLKSYSPATQSGFSSGDTGYRYPFCAGDVVTVTGSNVRLRSAPSLVAGTLTFMQAGQQMTPTGGRAEADSYVWWQLRGTVAGTYYEGWTAGNFLTK